jgi:hypothetical protein
MELLSVTVLFDRVHSHIAFHIGKTAGLSAKGPPPPGVLHGYQNKRDAAKGFCIDMKTKGREKRKSAQGRDGKRRSA